MKKIVLFLFLIISYYNLNAKEQNYDISILTMGPGESLSDAFGHSAIRVKSKSPNYDLVFNYGVYDFNDPYFYSNFIKGNLNYSLGVNYFEDTKLNYVSNNRSIKEQVLELPETIKQKIVNRLILNAKPENKNYSYDYFSNNCTTIINDIIDESLIENDYENYYVLEMRTSRNININWNYSITTPDDRIRVMIITTTICTRTHRYYISRFWHLIINFS